MLRDDAVVAFLLVAGLFFPTSIGGETRQLLIGTAFILLLGAVLILIWKHGTRPRAVLTITLPIMIVLTACTLVAYDFRFGWAILASYSAIAAIFALNLRKVRTGPLVATAFFGVNVVWILSGTLIVIGNSWMSDFLTTWYSQFYPDLVPGMVALHKPVLTFGTHSLAGFFTYLFFWLNWERYKSRRAALNLVFATCEFMLMIAIASFTSFALVALAISQIGAWLWKENRKAFLALGAILILMLALLWKVFGNEIDSLLQNSQFAAAALNPDNSGLVARYGVGGALRGTLDYIGNHPFTPIGFTFPSFLFLGDSGPVQYFLRGSILLLMLIYIGLYRFLEFNSPLRRYALTFFFVFLAFEIGFDALPYFRTLFLLPFFMAYIREITPTPSADHAHAS
jgi:hypothetical protein